MAWLFCSSRQIWSHSLCVRCGLRLTAPMCIDCFPGLLYLVHASTKDIECLATHPWHVVCHVKIYTNLRMSWGFCSSHQIWSHSLGALVLGWTGFQCIDCVLGLSDLAYVPTKGMGGNISMVCCSLCNNRHQPEHGMVVLLFSSPNLVSQLGCFLGLGGQHPCVLIVS